MFSLLLRLKRRIRRLLKVQAERRAPQAVTVRKRTVRYLLLIGAAILIGTFYHGDILYDPLDMPREGDIAPEDIVAPFPVTVYKNDPQIREEQDQIRRYTPFVLDRDSAVVEAVIGRLTQFAASVASYKRLETAARARRQTEFLDSLSNLYPNMAQSALIKALSSAVDVGKVRDRLVEIYREHIYAIGVIERLDELPRSANPSVLVRTGKRETLEDRGRIRDISLANARLTTVLNQMFAQDSIDVDLYYNVGKSFIRADLTPNPVEYSRRVNVALEQISTVQREVSAGDVIVSARQKVSAEQGEVLQEMVRVMRRQEANQGWLVVLLPVLARFLLVLAAIVALYLVLKFFRSDIAKSNPKLLALLLVFVLQMLLIYVLDQLGGRSSYLYPVAVLPIMVTILFDAEVGVLSTFLFALLLGVMHRFSYSLTLSTAVVGLVGCFTSRQVRKRSDFYRILLSLIVSYLLLILVIEKLKLTPNEDILFEMIYALAGSALSILIVTGVLPVFESLFGITTDTTLLELSDLNHPLLKRLSIEAPGTYHHSISVGNLSEAAAEAIGANALLARVGAYYHDIGKIEVPEYYVENQFSVRSKHEGLTPSMSTLILSSHVKTGRQLGEEADIPDDVLNFIEEHHGTMVMEYFYRKAVETEGDQVPIDKFRYPGPKPQTRETGIAMLADAVEAASRTLDDPKPARIDTLIQRIINNRFQSGELDECPLTLRDLAGISRAFAQVLIAAFHHRVKYPAEPNA
jgi:putative nucleotidyltransferase with HDIG domain